MLIGVNYEVASKGQGKVWRVFKDIDKGRKDSILVHRVEFNVLSRSVHPKDYKIGHAFLCEGDLYFIDNYEGETIAVINKEATVGC